MGNDMVEGAGKLYAWLSGHMLKLPKSKSICQYLISYAWAIYLLAQFIYEVFWNTSNDAHAN